MDGTPPGATWVSDDGLHAMGLDPQAFHPKNSDFRAALFYAADGTTVLAFKGTTSTSRQDWLNNGQ